MLVIESKMIMSEGVFKTIQVPIDMEISKKSPTKKEMAMIIDKVEEKEGLKVQEIINVIKV